MFLDVFNPIVQNILLEFLLENESKSHFKRLSFFKERLQKNCLEELEQAKSVSIC